MKKLLLILTITFCANISFAQTSTETFEKETSGATSFTDNGQTFNISSQLRGPFDIQTGFPGTGWNGSSVDNRYIDNDTFASMAGTQFTISSNSSFIVNNFYLYLGDVSANINTTGTVTITGKLGVNTVFAATQSTGFNTNFGINNGFSLINLTTFGSANNSNKTIDQIIISTGGSFGYVALDAFNWNKVVPLPLNLLNFTANATNQGGLLKWKTKDEINFNGFSIERANANNVFTNLHFITGIKAENYEWLDKNPLDGVNYYRLKMIDNDGSYKYSSIESLNFNLNKDEWSLYPTIVKDIINVKSAKGVISIIGINGKIAKIINILNGEINSINLSDLTSGVYLVYLKKQDDRILVKSIIKE